MSSAHTGTATENMKCPCCNNPWAAATGAFFTGSMICGECGTAGKGLDRANMDLTVSPADNFYYYSNGSWMKNNAIPSGYPNWNSFLQLHVQSQERCKDLLEGLKEGSPDAEAEAAAEAHKVAAYYKAALDEEAIEKLGTEPMKPLLSAIDGIVEAYEAKDLPKYASLLGKLDAEYGVSVFWDIGASPDSKNSSWTIPQLYQGGLGLPDRDYYFDEDKQEQRDKYVKHVANMFKLFQPSLADDEAAKQAKDIFELEIKLAEKHMTRTENRDPIATYNKMSIAELTEKSGNCFPFASYFEGSTGKTPDGLGDINVRNVVSIEHAAVVATTVTTEVLKSYLTWHAITSCASYLPKAFVDENFDFYERTLSGTAEIKPRWKRAMAFTESALGEALGKLYCAKYFDVYCKTRALTIVEQVRQALEDRLKEVEWMKSTSTREAALKKMERFKVKIGYPNKWIDYSTLTFEPGEPFLSMVFKSRSFSHRRVVKEMNAETDREKWFLTPQTVNAYYHPLMNEIVFPAAILQPPFFDAAADDAVNFGSMGAVVGHEMTHAFDDKGRKYNYDGILDDWWTPEDSEEYEKRVEVMVQQANEFQVHGKSVQGKLTSGENIADLGGLRLALRAMKSQPNFDPTTKIDGFTSVQRFFLAWSQCWRQNITKEKSLQLVTLDPHGPNEMRCNCPLSNMPEFHEAFQVSSESPMFKPVEKRVDIW